MKKNGQPSLNSARPLPPYTGGTCTCGMCGFDQADTMFVARGSMGRVYGQDFLTPTVNLLRRTCGRCGYQWDEATEEGDA